MPGEQDQDVLQQQDGDQGHQAEIGAGEAQGGDRQRQRRR